MMAKTTFAARWVTALQPPEAGQVDYFDNKPPSLGLRVTPHRHKTWFIMYRSGGRLRRLTLGTYPSLSLAEAWQHAMAAGIPSLRGAILQRISSTSAPPQQPPISPHNTWNSTLKSTKRAGVMMHGF
jgi:hypothetical protein